MTEIDDSIKSTPGIEWLTVGTAAAILALLLAGEVRAAVDILAIVSIATILMAIVYALADLYYLTRGKGGENDG